MKRLAMLVALLACFFGCSTPTITNQRHVTVLSRHTEMRAGEPAYLVELEWYDDNVYEHALVEVSPQEWFQAGQGEMCLVRRVRGPLEIAPCGY